MRILFLVHDFLPAHPSGTEVYTGALALRLCERGHEVRIFATEKDIARPHLTLATREWQGLVVHELVNNLFYADFRETWDFPPAAEAFAEVLDEICAGFDAHLEHPLRAELFGTGELLARTDALPPGAGRA